MFEIQPMNAQTYRQQTRRSTLIIALIFLALAMVLSTAAVALFGTPGATTCASTLVACLLRCWQWRR